MAKEQTSKKRRKNLPVKKVSVSLEGTGPAEGKDLKDSWKKAPKGSKLKIKGKGGAEK